MEKVNNHVEKLNNKVTYVYKDVEKANELRNITDEKVSDRSRSSLPRQQIKYVRRMYLLDFIPKMCDERDFIKVNIPVPKEDGRDAVGQLIEKSTEPIKPLCMQSNQSSSGKQDILNTPRYKNHPNSKYAKKLRKEIESKQDEQLIGASILVKAQAKEIKKLQDRINILVDNCNTLEANKDAYKKEANKYELLYNLKKEMKKIKREKK